MLVTSMQWSTTDKVAYFSFPLNVHQIQLTEFEKQALLTNTNSKGMTPSRNGAGFVIEGVETENVKLIFVVIPFSRPSKWQAVAIIDHGEIIKFPYRNYEDFMDVSFILEISSIQDFFLFHLCCFREYGLCDRNSLPKRVFTKYDLEAVNATITHEIELEMSKYVESGHSLWWHEWGGQLTAFKIDIPEKKIRFEILRRYLGSYKSLPIGMSR